MVSYRDPHVQRTLEQYRKVAEYLENFKATELELNKYVIGAISELDMPKSAYTKFLLGLSCYLSKLTQEDLQREREELLDVEEKDIRNLSKKRQFVLLEIRARLKRQKLFLKVWKRFNREK